MTTRTFRAGTDLEGREVTGVRLGDASGPEGIEATILDRGATLHRLRVDFGGEVVDVALGFPEVRDAQAHADAFVGALVGPYANRIAGGRFTLDGVVHELTGDASTCLHGGAAGFDSRTWRLVDSGARHVELALRSPDGEGGFPGDLDVRARYEVAGRELRLEVSATTSAPTVVSIASHAYLNLAGEGTGTVDDHVLEIPADAVLAVDEGSIPTGELAVDGTPFDLRRGARLGDVVRAVHPQLAAASGLDHSYVPRGEGMRRVATLTHPATGRRLDLHSDQPALQVYTANLLRTTAPGHGGRCYRPGDGIALEAQRCPDAPNRSWMPSAVLRPGETYRNRTRWTFS